jgi:hypothetical protein
VDAATFVDRLEQLQGRYGFRSFRFAGSNPPALLRKAIATEIIDRKIDVTFCGFAHVRGSYQDDYELLRKAGCRALAFGVESGSQRILDEGINKRVNVSEIREALSRCKSAGLSTIVSIIVPAPFETEQTKDETFRLLSEVRPDSTYVSFPALAPGTAWEKERSKFRFEIEDLDAMYREGMTYSMNTFSPAALWRPLHDYSLNGKSFSEIGRETTAFVMRLKDEGLTTQLFDQMFLMADYAGMTPSRFASVSSRCMIEGDIEGLSDLVSRLNEGALIKAADRRQQGRGVRTPT